MVFNLYPISCPLSFFYLKKKHFERIDLFKCMELEDYMSEDLAEIFVRWPAIILRIRGGHGQSAGGLKKGKCTVYI